LSHAFVVFDAPRVMITPEILRILSTAPRLQELHVMAGEGCLTIMPFDAGAFPSLENVELVGRVQTLTKVISSFQECTSPKLATLYIRCRRFTDEIEPMFAAVMNVFANTLVTFRIRGHRRDLLKMENIRPLFQCSKLEEVALPLMKLTDG
jgi:hypothetical protein